MLRHCVLLVLKEVRRGQNLFEKQERLAGGGNAFSQGFTGLAEHSNVSSKKWVLLCDLLQTAFFWLECLKTKHLLFSHAGHDWLDNNLNLHCKGLESFTQLAETH